MRPYARTVFLSRLLVAVLSVAALSAGAVGGDGVISSSSAVQDVPSLQLNQPIAATVKDNELHTYKIRAEAGMLVIVRVMQHGVDVAAQALDQQGARLARSEDSFGRVGPQLLEFVAETAGDYRVQVLARPGELSGRYEIKYLEARTVTSRDRTRLTAKRHLTAGNGYRSIATPERMRAGLAEYEKALTLFKQINDKAGQATSLQNTGRIYENQSDYRRALENYSAALALWREVPDRRGEGYATSNIGTMHLYLGDLTLRMTGRWRSPMKTPGNGYFHLPSTTR